MLGQRFALAPLQDMLRQPTYDPRALTVQNIVRLDGDLWTFTHALVWEGVLHSMLCSQLRAAHARAESWHSDRDLVFWAQHLERAADERATDAYRVAAHNQLERLCFKKALDLTTSGLALAGDAERAELHELAGRARMSLGNTAAAIDDYEFAMKAAADPQAKARIAIAMAHSLRVVGQMEEGLAALDQAESLASSPEALATIAMNRSHSYILLCKPKLAACATTRTLSLARERSRVNSKPRLSVRWGGWHTSSGEFWNSTRADVSVSNCAIRPDCRTSRFSFWAWLS